MIDVLPINVHPDVRSGVTMVDTTQLPWPGITFSQGACATQRQVEHSYDLLAATLGVPANTIVSVRQVHGTAVATAPCDSSTEADGIITADPSLTVGVKIADCLAILIYDPVHHVIAAVHSGWRGTAGNITSAAIARLQQAYHSDPGDLFVGLSPSASGTMYEVGEDVYRVLSAWCSPVEGRPGQWWYDNQQAVADQLEGAGVHPGRISRSEVCTIEDRRFHSHRRDRERAGRCFAFISLRRNDATQAANP